MNLRILCVLFILFSALGCSKDTDPNNSSYFESITIYPINVNIDENPNVLTTIAQISAHGGSGVLKYSLTSEDPLGALKVNQDTGEIIVLDSTKFDFEKYPLIEAEMRASDGDTFSSAALKITVRDLYEKYSYYGSISLETQEEVDDFAALNHIGVSGTLSIGSPYNNQIKDLSRLTSLQRVGSLKLVRLEIPPSGLHNLQSIEKDLIITQNTFMPNLDGLQSLDSIGRNLTFSYNNYLSDISSLNNVTYLGGDLRFQFNTLLPNMEFLSNVHVIPGDVYIWKNSSLTSLDGLNGILEIQGDLTILDNGVLTDLCALQDLFLNYGLQGEFLIKENGFNPRPADFRDGICSD